MRNIVKYRHWQYRPEPTLAKKKTVLLFSRPVGGIPSQPCPGVGIHHEEIFLPHLFLDAVRLDTREPVEGLLEVRKYWRFSRAVQSLELFGGERGEARQKKKQQQKAHCVQE